MHQPMPSSMNFINVTNYTVRNTNSKRSSRVFKSKITFVMLGLLFVSILGINFITQQAYGSQEDKVITVQPGDTLWSIAQVNYPEANTQEAIYYITKANKLDSSNLKIGSELHLPVF